MGDVEATIQSVCECQAQLGATLDKARLVLTSWAVRRDLREGAQAHSLGAAQDRFDVSWHCPFCGRFALRSFDSQALHWQEIERPAEPEPSADEAEQESASP